MEPDLFLRIDILLSKKRWSRSRLAHECSINVATLHGLWQKRRIPRGDNLVRIAKALDTTAEYLLDGEDRGYVSLDGTADNGAVIQDIHTMLCQLSSEELTELKGVIRGYTFNFFRSPPLPDKKREVSKQA